MDKFSAKIKESLQQVEVPEYNSAHFDSISRELDNQVNTKRIKAIGSAVLVAGSALFLFLNTETTDPKMAQADAGITNNIESQEVVGNETKTTAEKTAAKIEAKTEKTIDVLIPEVAKETVSPTLATVVTKNEGETKNNEKTSIAERLNAVAFAQKFNVCEKEIIEFNSDVDFPATYKWSFGDGVQSSEPNPIHAYAKSGVYKAYLVVTSLVDGRHKNVAIEKNIVVKAKPSGNIRFEEIEENAFNRKMQFNTEGNHQVISWIIKEKEMMEDAPVTSFLSKGRYPVMAVIKNEDNCYDTLRTMVTIDKVNNLLAPTAFSPNGDGRNDNFIPKALEDGSVNFNMQVLDTRTGSIVYQADNNLAGWNGIDSNSGKRCADGTYVWVVTVKKIDGTSDTFKGNVTLINN